MSDDRETNDGQQDADGRGDIEHRPVLVEEVVRDLRAAACRVVIDGTAGQGGHARALLLRMDAAGRLLLLDRDADALDVARRTLAPWAARCRFVQANFADMESVARAEGYADADAILLDLGVSSAQLERAERGFSFMKAGPLDMRMDQRSAPTAAGLVNGLPEAGLADLLRTLGEEREAKRIARAIARERAREPIATTDRLAAIVSGCKSARGARGHHPATRVFMALRMAVNGELEALEQGLGAAAALLRPGGRMAVISFHSLEDRMVKRYFAAHEARWESLEQGGRRRTFVAPELRRVTKRPLRPGETERVSNPRSRSAKLRVAERV